MRKIKIVMEYDGTNFNGFQVQPGKRTVESELNGALFVLLKEEVQVCASGRTDAGVHAEAQVAHFETQNNLSLARLVSGLNGILPSDVKILSAEEADKDFNARFSVKKKTYRYNFYLSSVERPLLLNRSLRLKSDINIKKMQEACKFLVGTQDFKCFVSSGTAVTDFVRTIYEAKIEKAENKTYNFFITGSGFMYNMVRSIMGTLILIGEGKKEPEFISVLINGQDRTKAGKTASAYALYLHSVEY